MARRLVSTGNPRMPTPTYATKWLSHYSPRTPRISFSNAMPRWSERVPQAELTFPHAARFGGIVPLCKMCRVLRSEDESRYQKQVQAMNQCPQQFSRMVAAGNVLASKMRTGSHIYPVGSQPVILKGLGLTHRVLQSMDAEHQPGLLTRGRLSLWAGLRTGNKRTRKGERWLTLEAAFAAQSN